MKVTIIVKENREPYYFITFVNVNKALYPYFCISVSDVGFNLDLDECLVTIRSMARCQKLSSLQIVHKIRSD